MKRMRRTHGNTASQRRRTRHGECEVVVLARVFEHVEEAAYLVSGGAAVSDVTERVPRQRRVRVHLA